VVVIEEVSEFVTIVVTPRIEVRVVVVKGALTVVVAVTVEITFVDV